MEQLRQHQKLFHIIFSKKTRNYTLLSRFLCTWEALIHSIMISEVKDMEVKFCGHLEKLQTKILQSFILNSILTIFKKKI